MTGFFVDLIEADLFGIESGGIQSDRASEEGKAQKSLSSWRAGPSGEANVPTCSSVVLLDSRWEMAALNSLLLLLWGGGLIR